MLHDKTYTSPMIPPMSSYLKHLRVFHIIIKSEETSGSHITNRWYLLSSLLVPQKFYEAGTGIVINPISVDGK